jgi:exopolyphosphatase / guanosine-5'-triphosphate,3'-diphosphate pyrophosphatase
VELWRGGPRRLRNERDRLPAAGECPSCPRPVCAAIDLGTNNCRLLIAEPIGDGFRVIDAFSRIVRLGEGVQTTQRLSDAAIARTLAALRVCSAKIRRRGVTRVRAVATEACRRAINCDEFVAAAAEDTGIELEIISSMEEGRLALAGCAPLLERTAPYAVVFDIGGGSTELMWMTMGDDGPRLLDQASVRCGVIDLAERYGGDRIDPEHYRVMVAEVATALSEFERRNGISELARAGSVQMLGTSGTVTTLAGVHMGLLRYDRRMVDGSYLRIEDALGVINHLTEQDFAGRAADPCIGEERADLVVAGCAVFQAISETWPVRGLRIADRGLREGILVDLIAGRSN